MTRKMWGFPLDVTDLKVMVREMKLGTGANPSSVRNQMRYHQDEGAARLYRAERRLRTHYDALDPSPELRFDGLPEVQAYVDRILGWPWTPKPWPVRVQATDGGPYYRSAIYLPDIPKARRELVVLHELAHHMSRQRVQDHGVQFLGAFLDLLSTAMGPDVRERFRECLRAEGVAA